MPVEKYSFHPSLKKGPCSRRPSQKSTTGVPSPNEYIYNTNPTPLGSSKKAGKYYIRANLLQENVLYMLHP